MIDTVDPAHMPPVSWRDYRVEAESRSEVAILVWRIVAEFIGDTTTPLEAVGVALWVPAEQYVRAHAGEAEQRTIPWERRDDEVIVRVLMDLGLESDYWRIKCSEQHKAFEDNQKEDA